MTLSSTIQVSLGERGATKELTRSPRETGIAVPQQLYRILTDAERIERTFA